jgi:hypothetical protein
MGLPPSTHLTCIPISLGQCKCVDLFSSHRHAPHDIGPSTRPCLYALRSLHLQVITAFGTPARMRRQIYIDTQRGRCDKLAALLQPQL